MAPTLIYLGRFGLWSESAASARVLGVAKALREAGFDVVIVGLEFRAHDRAQTTPANQWHHGFRYVTGGAQPANNVLSRTVQAIRGDLLGLTVVKQLGALQLNECSAFVAYNPPAYLLWRIQLLARQKGVPVVADCSEWYDPTHLLLGRLGPYRWDSEARMRVLQPRCQGMIAISSFLERHYSTFGLRVIRIPPLVDVHEPKWRGGIPGRRDDGLLRLGFAGMPGRKDLIANAIRSLPLLGSQAAAVRLRFIGPTSSVISACLGRDHALLREHAASIEVLGRVPHAQALEQIAECDFTVMLRPDARFAHAGFPTKLVESLALGVPMIGNLTSDIAMYVRDGYEGVILPDCSPEAFRTGVLRALSLRSAERASMRVSARQRAADAFDFRRWSAAAGEFMHQLIHNTHLVRGCAPRRPGTP